MDEELLQELLARASSLYNSGDYQGAIEAWNEVLKADPDNSKAREGIQMSHLLIGDLLPDPDPAEGAAPADGGEPAAVALTPREVEARLAEGLARVKALIAERKFPEALEGARSLVPIDPGSEEVQRLIEEAQQSFESAPFIEEHLTLARELMAQERYQEAEAECRKVFALDRSNPDAAALLDRMKKPAPVGTESAPPGPSEIERGEEPEIVEAKEVVPPSVRAIPASEDDAAAKARLLEDPDLMATSGEQKDPAEWESELARLNLRQEENDLLGRKPQATQEPDDATDADSTPVPDVDADLMSLLDQEFTGSEGPIISESENEPGSGESIPLAQSDQAGEEPAAEEEASFSEYGIPAAPPIGETMAVPVAPSRPAPVEEFMDEAVQMARPAPEPEPRSRPARRRTLTSSPVAGRSSIPRIFALVGVLMLLAGGTAWWFLFRPSVTGAQGNPGGTATPPAGSSSTPPAAAEAGPIPTPIGGPSRKPVQPASGNAAVAGVVEPDDQPEAAPAAEIDTRATTSLSPQEVERRIAGHLSRGRRLQEQEDWQGLRKEMRGAMALDPFNLQVRELSDRADARIEEQEASQREFSEIRRMFDQQDYQATLWKLYRIERKPALGDVDRYIRNSWYNWAVTSMRAGNNSDAMEKIGEALSADPEDREARKLQGFAERYAERAKDDVYYAFADSIELRSIDE